MRALVDTPTGRRFIEIRGRSSAQRAADLLCERNCEIVGELPPVYSSGVRYRRERDMPELMRRPFEVWQDAARALSVGMADCEDLAAWRAAELVTAGIDPAAGPFVYAPRRGLLHVIVARGDGSVEDPSAILGMRKRMINGVRYKFGRRRGQEVAGLAVPMGGETIKVVGRGPTRAHAMADAVRRLDGFIVEGIGEIGADAPVMDLGSTDVWSDGPSLAGGGFGSGGRMGGGAPKPPAGGGGGSPLNPLTFLGQGVEDITGRFLGGGSGGGGKLPADGKKPKTADGAGVKGPQVDNRPKPPTGGGASNGGLTIKPAAGVRDLGVPSGAPIVAPSLFDKLDTIRELAELSKSGDLRAMRKVIRGGGPIAKLARELVRGLA